ncbi:Ubiquitin carboxyl-terminal hydrolase 12 [Capsicum chinense]|nr:Ubiquitin carboxyl-terminal hydrolase 12 [Capsicum chinense]
MQAKEVVGEVVRQDMVHLELIEDMTLDRKWDRIDGGTWTFFLIRGTSTILIGSETISLYEVVVEYPYTHSPDPTCRIALSILLLYIILDSVPTHSMFYCQFGFFLEALQEDEEMLVPRSDLVFEGPQPMEVIQTIVFITFIVVTCYNRNLREDEEELGECSMSSLTVVEAILKRKSPARIAIPICFINHLIESKFKKQEESYNSMANSVQVLLALWQLRDAQPEIGNDVEKQPPEDPQTSRFTWKIDNFSRLNIKKLYSDTFVVGGYKWRILIFPKGNNVDYLSMYLDVADSANLPYGWSRYAQFSLSVVNQIHNKYSIRKETQHQFNARESDWGFTSFMPLGELYDPNRGYIVDDACVIEAEVAVRKIVDYWSYDSKKETGFVGLKNQGATCYMNSLLQTLYHIPYFRKVSFFFPFCYGADY